MTTCICYRVTLAQMPIESVSFLLMALPVIAFACLWYLTAFSNRQDWRVGFLKAALLWGSATLLITEVLSVFAAIRPTTLALAWIVVIVSLLYVIRRRIVEEAVPLACRKDTLHVAGRKSLVDCPARSWPLRSRSRRP